jgi:hypothetical protein
VARPGSTEHRLERFAWLRGLDGKLETLSGSIGQLGGGPVPAEVLMRYVHHVFNQAAHEGAVAREGAHACFGLGITDAGGRELYAAFVRNPNPGSQEWELAGFGSPEPGLPADSRSADAILARRFATLPAAPRRIAPLSGFVFDARARVRDCDWLHAIEDHPERFPRAWLSRYVPEGILRLLPDSAQSHAGDKGPDMDAAPFQKAMAAYRKSGALPVGLMTEDLERARDRSLAAVRSGRIAAEPFLHISSTPEGDRPQHLLPISLPGIADEGGARADLALALEPDGRGGYRGKTLLTLAMARFNSRITGYRDRDGWLMTGRLPERPGDTGATEPAFQSHPFRRITEAGPRPCA